MQKNEQSAFSYALHLLSFRDYSEYELREKLNKKFDRNAVENAIEKLKREGLLSDKQYVENIIRKYAIVKKYGYLKVEQELLRRGIKKEFYRDILDELYNEDKEEENALSISLKKPLNKLRVYLISRGYRPCIVQKVLAAMQKK